MKPVHFIDGGANVGQTIEVALEKYGDNLYRIDSFEPQQQNVDILRKKYCTHPKIRLYNNALWIKDCRREFYTETIGCRTGSSLLWKNEVHDSIEIVYCVDLLRWLRENLKKEHYNILKLDIEGSEYEVLSVLMSSNIDEVIDEWWVEFHNNEKIVSSEERIMEEFLSKNYKINDWGSQKSETPEGKSVFNTRNDIPPPLVFLQYVKVTHLLRKHIKKIAFIFLDGANQAFSMLGVKDIEGITSYGMFPDAKYKIFSPSLNNFNIDKEWNVSGYDLVVCYDTSQSFNDRENFLKELEKCIKTNKNVIFDFTMYMSNENKVNVFDIRHLYGVEKLKKSKEKGHIDNYGENFHPHSISLECLVAYVPLPVCYFPKIDYSNKNLVAFIYWSDNG